MRKRATPTMKHEEFVSVLDLALDEIKENKYTGTDTGELIIHLATTAYKTGPLQSPIEISATAQTTVETLQKFQLPSNHKLVGDGTRAGGLYNLGTVIRFDIQQKGEKLLVIGKCEGPLVLVEEFLNLWDLLDIDERPTAPALEVNVVRPKIEDPTDQRIWDIVQQDPSITDTALGQKLGIKRQNANARRRALEKMGYKVRVS